MPVFIQSSFSRGEISPALYGRVDTIMYQAGLRTARNVIPHAYGGVSNRPGLQHVGPCHSHTDTLRLIPFKFKTTDTYILEFGDQYMRVIRNDAYVLEGSKNITGATQADPVVITAGSHGFSDGDMVYIQGVVGMTELNDRFFYVNNKTTNTFEIQSPYGAAAGDIDGTGFTAYSSAGTASRVFSLTTPYDDADLAQLKYEQSADVMTLTHRSYETRELTRTGHSSWTISTIDHNPDTSNPTGASATQNGTTGSEVIEYLVTALDLETNEESAPATTSTTASITGATAADPVVITASSHGFSDGDVVKITSVGGMLEINNRVFTIRNTTTHTFELQGEDGSDHTAYTSGGTATLLTVRITDGNATLSATNNVSVSWTEGGSDNDRFVVYKRENGLFGFLGETSEETFTDDGSLSPNLDITPPTVRYPFIGSGNYPGAVGRFQQRRVLGGSTNNPDTSEYSRTGQQDNFSRSRPTADDDAITATFDSSEVDEIRHYVALNDLLVLTSGAEWLVTGTPESGLTPASINQLPQSRWGSSHRRPINAGEAILFVQDDKRTVRSLGFSFDLNGYTGTELSLLASHLFRDDDGDIVEWAYSRSPDPVIAAVKSDGEVATLTILQEQQVIAWAHWDTKRTNGKFQSVAVVRPSATDADEVFYFVVRRTINGNQVQYVERLHSRRFTTVEDCFFVDSGLSLDSPVTITGATQADPVVITAASHGFSDGDEVDITGITWAVTYDASDNEVDPDHLNGGRYTVANKTANTFELTDSAGSNIDGSAFSAYVEGGEVRKAVSTVSGLHHLEGETIVALADGNVVKDLTVTDGAITLARKASRVHAGITYVADVETLDPEIVTRTQETIQHRNVLVPRVTVRFERSRGLLIGPSSDKLKEMKQRELEAYGVPTQLLTGDKTISVQTDWDSHGRVFMRQRDPLPMTILAVIPELELGTDTDD